MIVEKSIFPSDQFPEGFNQAKTPEVTSLIFVQVILFIAAVIDGPEASSVSAAPDPRVKELQQELNRERREAKNYKAEQETKTRALEGKLEAHKVHSKSQEANFESQLEALRKEMKELVLQRNMDSPQNSLEESEKLPAPRKKDPGGSRLKDPGLESSRSGEFGLKGGRGMIREKEEEDSDEEEEDVSSEFGSVLEVSSSAKNEEAKRKDRLKTEQDNYDSNMTRSITMLQINTKLRCKEGFYIYDTTGSAHAVGLFKNPNNKILEHGVVLISGPPGKRLKSQCGINDDCPCIYPRSQVQYLDFIREQTQLLRRCASVASNAKDYVAYQRFNEKLDILNQFNDEFTRRMELVMGSLGMQRPHHVTRWAVFLHFLIVTWNTAMVREEFKYLVLDFDIRWNREFEPRTQESNGRTVARIQDCMQLLLYVCHNQTCGAVGWCDEMCFYCKTSPQKAVMVTTATKLPGYHAAFRAYQAIGNNKTTGSQASFYATPAGALFKNGTAAFTTPEVYSNVTEAYEFLEVHQHIVVAHASIHRTTL